MLVMTRKKNESIVIQDEIEVVILEVDQHRVKVGIQAPSHMKIMRKEVLEEVKSENKQALMADLNLLTSFIKVRE